MCLLALLVAVQLSNVSVLRFLDIKYFSFVNVSMPVSEVSHNLNLPTVCVRNWCRNFNEAFLSLTQVQKLVHKKCIVIAPSVYITSMSFLAHTLVNYQ